MWSALQKAYSSNIHSSLYSPVAVEMYMMQELLTLLLEFDHRHPTDNSNVLSQVNVFLQ